MNKEAKHVFSLLWIVKHVFSLLWFIVQGFSPAKLQHKMKVNKRQLWQLDNSMIVSQSIFIAQQVSSDKF